MATMGHPILWNIQPHISSLPGELVLDFTAGSGSTAIAAIRSGREWIAIEKSDEYYDVAKGRIAAEMAGEQEAA